MASPKNNDIVIPDSSAIGSPGGEEVQQGSAVDVSVPDQVEEPSEKAFEVAKDPSPLLTNASSNHENVKVSNVDASDLKQSLSESTPDASQIAVFLQVDDQTLNSVDAVILQKIQARVEEFNQLRSDKMILEVKLDQSTHLVNKKVDMFKNQLSKSQKENGELREKNSSLESSKFEIEKRLSELEMEFKTSSSASIQDKTKIEELLAGKRKTAELLEKKNQELESLKSEYNQLQESNSAFRKDLIELETSNQSVNSTLVHTKMKLQSLETQIELTNKNNDWLNSELKKVSNEFSQYRKDKSAENSKLQIELDGKTSDLNSLNLKFNNLSARFDDVSKNLDNALQQIKSLKDEKSLNHEEYVKEISVKDRLVNLLKQSNEDLKAKVAHLEEMMDSSRSGVASESAVLKTSLDECEAKLAESEQKIHQLEQTIEELSNDMNIDADLSGIPVLSPSAKTAAKHSGLSLSQLYGDFALVKRQLIQERRAKERMQQQMDAFVQELEQKAPMISATKERAHMLEQELTELSAILESTAKEKDILQKSQKELSSKLQEDQLQISTLNKQRVDLARQVQNLLVQVTVRGDSGGPLTPAEHQAIQRIANGDTVVSESDTDKLISERLVIFQNIVDLQTKNEELLRVIRDLGAKLEQEEQTSKSRLEDLENTAISEAKDAILTLQDELQSAENKLNSVTRERDMFRSILSNKGSSSNILTGGFSSANNEEISSLSKKYEESQRELANVNDHLRQIKVESDTTISLLNKQINTLSVEKSELSINLAREKSSTTLLGERYNASQDNLKFAKSEIEELRKRSQLLQDNLAKQDLRTQHVAEELIEAKSTIETLRSESSNLKAEKQLWKTIEQRLTEENSSLIEERARLNSLLMNLQTLDKEREANATEAHRRLVQQSESLESELNSYKARLNEASSELKGLRDKKEADSKAYQERIDSLRSELSSTREELIKKNGAVEQAEQKVALLTSRLNSAESRLKDFQTITETENSESTLVNETLRLKAELEEAKSELEESNNSVVEFKNIAAAAEEALASMNTSFDNYKEHTTQEVENLESENKSLTEKIGILSEQIEQLSSELSTQKSNSAKELEITKHEIETLKSQVVASDKLKEEYDAKVELIESSYQQQVSIASEAQSSYEKELQTHAAVSKAYSSLREETNSLKSQLHQLSAESKQAKEELRASQESWESQKSKLEEELRVTAERAQDLSSQNHILYNQIESLTKRNEENVISGNGTAEAFENISVDGATDELRELISLLRREKEISDAQLDVTTRDLKRTRQQLELVTGELDRTRLELSKTQNRDSDLDRFKQDHDKLLQEIQQLNLLRESNVTLRNELQSNITKVKELEQKLSESNAKLEPLESQVTQLEAEVAHKNQEAQLIIEEKERWKQRSQDILNKYDRIDPAEHTSLKEEVGGLKTKIGELVKSLESETTKAADVTARLERLKTEAQDKLRKRAAEQKALQNQLAEVQKELSESKDSSNSEIERLTKQVQFLEEQLNSKPTENSTEDVESAKKEVEMIKKEMETVRNELNKKTSDLASAKTFEIKFNEAQKLNSSLEARVTELEQEITKLKFELDAKTAALSKKTVSAPEESAAASDGSTVDDLKAKLASELENLAKQKQELEAEKTELSKNKNVDGSVPGETIEEKEVALKEQETKLRAEFEIESKKRISEALENLKARIRAPSEARLQELTEKKAQSLKAEYEKKLASLKTQYEKESQAASGSQDAVAKVKGEFEAKISALEKNFEEEKKKAFNNGRDATMKEVTMRMKLLQSKTDKLAREKKEIEEKLVQITSGAPAQVLAKRTPPLIDAGSTVKTSNNETSVVKSAEIGDKRPAEGQEGQEGPEEKKVKNEEK